MVRFLIFAALLSAGPAPCADDAFFLGAWKIVSAVDAPWATSWLQPDAGERKELVGRAVTFERHRILGPRQVACPDPKYEIKDYPADMLFEGAFGEMHSRDQSIDPARIAEKLGFKGSSWKTLETGCANEIDWHFIDQTTAAIGLNNSVYILKKR
jgi:hypothetical protein